MAERTATNPETGEKLKLVGNQWVPLDGVPGSPAQRPSSEIVADNASRTFLNNIMALPSATGDLLAGGAGLLQTVAETPFAEAGFGDRLSANVEAQGQKFPANMLSSIPRPTVTDVTSAFGALPALAPGGQSFGDAFSANKAQSLQAQAMEAEQRPGATMGGEVLGDVLSLAAGRQPFAKGLVDRASSMPTVTNKATRDALEVIAREQPDLVPQIAELVGGGRLATPGAQRLFHRVIESGPVRSVLRGLGKAAETSLEGAVMAAIKENDPVTNAGLAGGAQLGASMVSSIIGVPKSLKDLAWKAGGWFVLFRTAQEFGAGENDMFAASDSTFKKLAMGVTLGLTSQVVGGRFRGSDVLGGRKFAEDLPRFTDAINSVPRGVLHSLLNHVQAEQEEGRSLTLPTLEILSSNPSAFPTAIRNRLSRALNNGNLPEEVQKMRGIEEFTSVLDTAQGN